ncbi:MAG: ABC transporter ATP-binding protein [Candidatus Saccharicenans sp.]|nr:ABC transporter ATP-binding protein [Candidatus Saccharicenans sp.]
MKATPAIIEAENIKKIYKRGAEEIAAINGLSVAVNRGDFIAFVGPSGSGKTTLLNLLGCLDNPTSGKLTVNGRTVHQDGRGLSESQLTRIRRELFGYIFQKFYLIPTLTVLENILVPFAFFRKEGASQDVLPLLKKLGLENRMNHLPGQLSGGEMQRVAIARALVNRPEVLLADEPTGNLDSERSREIGKVLRQLNEEEGLTVLLVTHNLELAAMARLTISLRDGRIA